MDQENLDYLKNMMKNFGFSDKLNDNLEATIKREPKEFQLKLLGDFKGTDKKVDFGLDFKKSETSERYFFNKYSATLVNGETVEQSQTFYVGKGSPNVTAKEAFNMLEGRAVYKTMLNKENEQYNAWVQLKMDGPKDKYDNFEIQKFYDSYKFDLDQAVMKHPVKGLDNEQEKEKLMKSLQKGNLQQVTYVVEGKEQKMFLAASPQYK